MYKKLNAANKELNLYKERLKKINGEYFALDKIIGESKEIKQLKKVVSQVANTDSTILITGESGTGKEVFANAIHEISDRRDNNFIKINCAAIPENILESELFGYEEGAFTGAKRGGKAGKFELAHGGTILLDEIGDMSLNMQAKILRVLQEKEVMRVGGYKANKIDVRIIAATNQNLQEKIKKGEFREDLYFRLNVVNLNLPALRERPDDIKTLCDYFITIYNKKFGIYVEQIEDDALQHMIKYPWPGNVRELRNAIERAYNFVNGNTIKTEHLPSKIINQQMFSRVGDLNKILDDVERRSILEALETTKGNKSRAAKILGINRSGLYQKLKKHGIPTNF
ncbi:MAG TPA: sigma 54-interacting transcriptional regulator [Thermoanaerobacterales bacterium]|nr:sigma 54-interacting transcriptional regulator [Thermoanaerobacterales bacterium]